MFVRRLRSRSASPVDSCRACNGKTAGPDDACRLVFLPSYPPTDLPLMLVLLLHDDRLDLRSNLDLQPRSGQPTRNVDIVEPEDADPL